MSSKDETSMYSEKPEYPHSDGLDELHKPLNVGVDKMKLKNTILYDNHEYEQKLELGKAIHEIVINHEVLQHSLRPEYKEVLDLYMKESVKSFPKKIWNLNPE